MGGRAGHSADGATSMGTRPGLEEGSGPASPWGGQGPTTWTAYPHPRGSLPGPGLGAPAGKHTVPQGPVSHVWRPQAQPLTPTKSNATYISLKLNKLANVLSSNVEILLLLMSLEERGDLVRSEQCPHNRNADKQPPPAHPWNPIATMDRTLTALSAPRDSPGAQRPGPGADCGRRLWEANQSQVSAGAPDGAQSRPRACPRSSPAPPIVASHL